MAIISVSLVSGAFAKKAFITCVLAFFCFYKAFGQRHEIGTLFGGTYYLGDLNPVKQFALTRIALGGMYRINFNQHLAARASVFYGSVEGNDALLRFNPNRNLRFVSEIFEASGQFEINFLQFTPGNFQTPFTPFIFLGGGILRFYPKAQIPDNGVLRWTSLHGLQTEGIDYSRTAYTLLFGGGLKFNITKRLTGSIEWGLRRAGTDYLDDVSSFYPDMSMLAPDDPRRILSDPSLINAGQNAGLLRGNPNTNDWYSFAGFGLSIKIPDIPRGKCP
ncbi:MAG TPA: DUF6089 family protein [Bacteroidales bacterium]|nr:DUF6089 family protein [Bacteroidales bacterium]